MYVEVTKSRSHTLRFASICAIVFLLQMLFYINPRTGYQQGLVKFHEVTKPCSPLRLRFYDDLFVFFRILSIHAQAIAKALPGIPSSSRRTPTRVSGSQPVSNNSPLSPVNPTKGGLFGIFGKWADDAIVVTGKEGGGSSGGAGLTSEPDQGQGAVEAAEEGDQADRGTTAAAVEDGASPRGQGGDPADRDSAAAVGEGSVPPLKPGGDSVRSPVQERATPLPAEKGDSSSSSSAVSPSGSPPPAAGSSSRSPAETAWSILSRGRTDNVSAIGVSGGGGGGGGVGGSTGGVGGGGVIADEDGDGGDDGAVVLFQLLMQRWELRPWVVGPRTLVATKEQVRCAVVGCTGIGNTPKKRALGSHRCAIHRFFSGRLFPRAGTLQMPS